MIANDIAPQQIIDNCDVAHDFVRLYFRPRNPTQFHIEGIRKSKYFYNGKHAGVLVMLVFDAEIILTRSDTRFSCGNMQAINSIVRNGDNGWDQLDFISIYHDSAHGDPEITRKRCAEVLVPSPLNLTDSLRAVYVRTDADAAMLRQQLENDGFANADQLVRKSTGTGIFFGNYTAVDFVDFYEEHIFFRLLPTKAAEKIATEIIFKSPLDGKVLAHTKCELDQSTRYQWCHGLPSGTYDFEILLESCPAHKSRVNL